MEKLSRIRIVKPYILVFSRNPPRSERKPISRHELKEYMEMEYRHKWYDTAHKIANVEEAKYRGARNGGRPPFTA